MYHNNHLVSGEQLEEHARIAAELREVKEKLQWIYNDIRSGGSIHHRHIESKLEKAFGFLRSDND